MSTYICTILRRVVICFSVWCGMNHPALAETSPTGHEAVFRAGMNVLLLPNEYNSLDELDWKTDALLDTLSDLGVNALNLDWLLYTEDVYSNQVSIGEKTPDTAAITLVTKKALARGFIVGFRPIIDEASIVAHGKKEWRGTIRPRDVSAWFTHYDALLLSYATLAEETGAHFLIVGTELNSMEEYPDRWEKLIGAIREVYHGELSYSSNQLISTTMPWNKLDFIGVDAFLELQTPKTATVPELIAAWQRWIPPLVNRANELGLPLVFTEIGVASQTGATRRSWIWDHHTPVNLETQRRFYEAACTVWKDKTAGMYWWVVHSNIWMIPDPQNDPTFSPLGKPAATEIQRCFIPPT